MTKILPIPREMVGVMWMHVSPHLLRGLTAATNVTLREITDDIVADKAQLWGLFDGMEVVGAFITATYEDRGEKFLGVYALGGTGLHDWAEQLGETMVVHARKSGAPKVKFAGRAAWSRVLPTYKVTDRLNGEAVFERKVL